MRDTRIVFISFVICISHDYAYHISRLKSFCLYIRYITRCATILLQSRNKCDVIFCAQQTIPPFLKGREYFRFYNLVVHNGFIDDYHPATFIWSYVTCYITSSFPPRGGRSRLACQKQRWRMFAVVSEAAKSFSNFHLGIWLSLKFMAFAIRRDR